MWFDDKPPVFSVSEGRRFISEDRKEGDVYDTLHLGTKISLLSKTLHTLLHKFPQELIIRFDKTVLSGHLLAMIVQIRNLYLFFYSLSETRSQNTEKLSVDQAATVLLNFLQQAREGGEVRFCASWPTAGV